MLSQLVDLLLTYENGVHSLSALGYLDLIVLSRRHVSTYLHVWIELAHSSLWHFLDVLLGLSTG